MKSMLLLILIVFLASTQADFIAGDFLDGNTRCLITLDIAVNPPKVTSRWCPTSDYLTAAFAPSKGLFYVLNYGSSSSYEFFSVDPVANKTSDSIPFTIPVTQAINGWEYDPVYGLLASTANGNSTDFIIYSINIFTGACKQIVEFKSNYALQLFLGGGYYDQTTHSQFFSLFDKQYKNGSEGGSILRIPLSGGMPGIYPYYSQVSAFEMMVYDPSTEGMLGLNVTWSQSTHTQFIPRQIKISPHDWLLKKHRPVMAIQDPALVFSFNAVGWNGFDSNPTFTQYSSPHTYSTPYTTWAVGGLINQDNSALIVLHNDYTNKISSSTTLVAWYYKNGTFQLSDPLMGQSVLSPMAFVSYYA